MPTRVYGASGGGMGNKGYPTADVTGIVLRSLSGLKVGIRWTDPDDTVLDNAVLSDWASTIIVRKDGSVPESIKDGVTIIENTVHNQYQETEYIDQNGLEGGHTYYYRFFTKSAAGVIGDGSPTVKMTAKAISPVLAENDWKTIIEVAESGAAAQTWKVGDEIDIQLTDGTILTFQIWDFDHFDKSDGSGKTAITFGTKHLAGSEREIDVDDMKHRKSQPLKYYNKFPDEIKNAVKSFKHVYTTFNTEKEENVASVIVPNATEIGFRMTSEEGNCFPIFTSTVSRIKKYENGNGDAGRWPTCTERYNGTGAVQTYIILSNESGNYSTDYVSYNNSTIYCGICFFFNI